MCFKKYLKWVKKGIKKMTPLDMALTKIGLLAFGLMLAVLIPVLTTVQWYWYLIIFVVVIITPAVKFFKK